MKYLATITALALATCSPAIAGQPVCGGMDGAFRALINLGEVPVMMATDQNGFTVSIWINEETATWSYVVTDVARQRSCLVDHGANAEIVGFVEGERA